MDNGDVSQPHLAWRKETYLRQPGVLTCPSISPLFPSWKPSLQSSTSPILFVWLLSFLPRLDFSMYHYSAGMFGNDWNFLSPETRVLDPFSLFFLLLPHRVDCLTTSWRWTGQKEKKGVIENISIFHTVSFAPFPNFLRINKYPPSPDRSPTILPHTHIHIHTYLEFCVNSSAAFLAFSLSIYNNNKTVISGPCRHRISPAHFRQVTTTPTLTTTFITKLHFSFVR